MKKEIDEFIRLNPLIRAEFEDLLYSDKDFNYSKNEFRDWLIDLVLPFIETNQTAQNG